MGVAIVRRQNRDDRQYILDNLGQGVYRIQVINGDGAQEYKKPNEVDLDLDEIVLNKKDQPIVMKGKPGRPSKKKLKPVSPQIAEVVRAREEHIEYHSLVITSKKGAGEEAALDEIILGLSQECASIEFQRMEAERHGEDTTDLSVKRSRVLKATADVVLKRKALNSGGAINMESREFTSLFSYLLETFREAMTAGGCRTEQIEQVFTVLSSSLAQNSWKEEAKVRMKGGR